MTIYRRPLFIYTIFNSFDHSQMVNKTLHGLRWINPGGSIIKFKSLTTEAREALTAASQATIRQLSNQTQTFWELNRPTSVFTVTAASGRQLIAETGEMEQKREEKRAEERREESRERKDLALHPCHTGPAPWTGTANYMRSEYSITPQIRFRGKAAAQLCHLFIHTLYVTRS